MLVANQVSCAKLDPVVSLVFQGWRGGKSVSYASRKESLCEQTSFYFAHCKKLCKHCIFTN